MSIPGFLKHLFYNQWLVTVPVQTASFEGQTIIVTGANVGLGFEAAKYFAANKAAKVILACRSLEKADTAKKQIEEATKRTGVVETWQLDLGSHESVKDFAAKATAELDRLDVLLCNAGVNQPVFKLVEGFESNISINVISTFLLSMLLLPKLKESATKYPTSTPHLTIVASDTHWVVTLPEQKNTTIPIFTQLNDEKKARMSSRYPLSKLLDVLVTRYMATVVAPAGYPVIINSVNPGLCHSELSRDAPSVLTAIVHTIFHARRTEVGARNLVFAARAGKEFHGKYISECKEGPLSPYVTSKDGEEAATRVWQEFGEKLETIQAGIMKNL